MEMLITLLLCVGLFLLLLAVPFTRARLRAAGTRIADGWVPFWFTPRDPTVLGLIRISCGAITTYTIIAYSFLLQDFMGKDGWYDLSLRARVIREAPTEMSALSGRAYP